jgi:integrase
MGLYKRGRVWYMDFLYGGRRYRKSTETEDKNEAQQVYGETLKELSKEQPDNEKPFLTFKELIAFYEKDDDAKGYVIMFKKVYLDFFGDREISRISRKDLYAFRDKLRTIKKQRGGRELSKVTVNRALAGLRRLFHFAVAHEKLNESPFPKEPKSGLFCSEKKSRNKRKYFTQQDVRKIVESCPDHPDFLRPFVITAYMTGCRAGELIHLEWKEVNLDDGIITLRDTKAGEDQQVKMQDGLIELFRGLPKRSEFVFCQEDGRELKHHHYYEPYKKIMKAIGKEKGWNFHTLRHTTGTHLHLKGASPVDIKDQLRHSDIRVTVNYYIGTDSDHQKKIAEMLTPTIWQDARA